MEEEGSLWVVVLEDIINEEASLLIELWLILGWMECGLFSWWSSDSLRLLSLLDSREISLRVLRVWGEGSIWLRLTLMCDDAAMDRASSSMRSS
jgi:hypothetical protein